MGFKEDFKESNRNKHFFYAIPVGLVLTILCVIDSKLWLEISILA